MFRLPLGIDRLPAVPLEPSSEHIHSLNGLRAVSALIVVVAHFGLDHVIPGGLGVTIFFFISGFLITRLLLAEADRTGGIALVAFYRRRFWRLWPAIAGAVLGAALIGAGFREIWVPIANALAALSFTHNYWSVIAPVETPINPQWSLGVEFHFYLLWPVMLLGLLARPALAVAATGAILLAFLAFRLWTALAIDALGLPWAVADLWTYSLSHLRGDSILYGCLLALMAHDPRHRRWVRLGARPAAFWLGIALLLATLLLRDELFRATARYSVQGVALFLIFAGILFAERGSLARWLLNLPLVNWLGLISYSVYLWHLTIWRAVLQIAGRDGGLDLALIAAALTILAAWLSYHVIEKQFISLGRRLEAVAAP
jgi:peptidoglycan/LPS O-acetylase OafA/YrhL